MNSIETFKCKICSQEKRMGEIISLEKQICCACFQSIQMHTEVREKIDFYKTILSEEDKFTPIRRRKIHQIEKMNDLFSFGVERIDGTEGRDGRANILKVKPEELGWYMDDYYINQKRLSALRYRKNKYYLKKYSKEYYDFDRMKSLIASYQSKINNANTSKTKFTRFIEIIGDKSEFKTLKNKLMDSLFEFIDEEKEKDFIKLKSFIMDGVAENYEIEPNIMPNVSLFFYNHYEFIFSTLLSEIFPFNKLRLAFDDPVVNSRTDFALKLFYRYNHIEINAIERKIEELKLEKMKVKMVCKFLFINAIKTITRIMDDVFKLYYRKLGISSPVRTIINTPDGSKQKTTKRYNEVTYWIAMREW